MIEGNSSYLQKSLMKYDLFKKMKKSIIQEDIDEDSEYGDEEEKMSSTGRGYLEKAGYNREIPVNQFNNLLEAQSTQKKRDQKHNLK